MLAESLLALLRVAPAPAIAAARALLASRDADLVEVVALACAESRLAAVALPLSELFERSRGSARGVALRALALLRHDEALAILMRVVREGAATDAIEALRALAAQPVDDRLRRSVAEAVAGREEPDVVAAARRLVAAD